MQNIFVVYVWRNRAGKKAIKKVFKFVFKVIAPIILGGIILAEVFGGGVIIGTDGALVGGTSSTGVIGTHVTAAAAKAAAYTIWSPAALMAAPAFIGSGSSGSGGGAILDPITPTEPTPKPDGSFEIDPHKIKIRVVLTDPGLPELNSPKHADGYTNVDPYKEKGFDLNTFQQEVYKAQGGKLPKSQKQAPNGQYVNQWENGNWTYSNGNPFAETTTPDGYTAYLDENGVWRYTSGSTMPTTQKFDGVQYSIGTDGQWRDSKGRIYEPYYYNEGGA